MNKYLIGLITVATGIGAVPAAAAQAEFETVAGVVEVGDLDFTNAADIARFERRVSQRARALCDGGRANGAADQRAEAACLSSVKASAQGQLPQLVAESRARSGVRLALKAS